MASFDSEELLPNEVFAQITDIRVNDPMRVCRAAERRQQRDRFAADGRLNLVAADHPARRAVRVGNEPLRMADRRDLLARLVRVLAAGAADGVLATMDVIEELLLLDDMLREAGGPSLLDSKLMIASLNRGGLAGVSWELDDTWTGPSFQSLRNWKLDGAKVLWRVLDDDPGSLATMNMCAEAARQLEAIDLPLFIEPLPMIRSEHGLRVDKRAEPLAQLVGVAAALGNSSRHLWLKLPTCPNYEIVASATTLPILVLGGEVAGDRQAFYEQLTSSLASGSNVRGTMIGRNVLYPPEGDPLLPARVIHSMVHEGLTWADAESRQNELSQIEDSGRSLDVLHRWLAG